MANQEHLRILSNGVKAWNRSREDNRDMEADLQEADLQEADLEQVNLEQANLRRANLWEADLRGANLRGANLRGAILMGVDLEQAELERAELERAELERAKLMGANLRGANLRGADLQDASLKGANFKGAYLGRANLRETNLSGADLQGAKLGEANLEGATLRGANLRGANLRGANLRGADLGGADLRGASLEDAILAWTFFFRSDLAEVGKLESCIHLGPSNIDHETIAKSGYLPTKFLRGCGLSDWQIEGAKLNQADLTQRQLIDVLLRIKHCRSQNPVLYYSYFISYSQADKSFARRLHDNLQDKGIRVWLAEYPMLPADNIYETENYDIRLWDKILLCCSKYALTSWWVDNEIDTAIEKERRLMKECGKKVLALMPLDLDGYMSTYWKSGKKQQLHSRPAADFKRWDKEGFDFDNHIEKVITALQADEDAPERQDDKLKK